MSPGSLYNPLLVVCLLVISPATPASTSATDASTTENMTSVSDSVTSSTAPPTTAPVTVPTQPATSQEETSAQVPGTTAGSSTMNPDVSIPLALSNETSTTSGEISTQEQKATGATHSSTSSVEMSTQNRTGQIPESTTVETSTERQNTTGGMPAVTTMPTQTENMTTEMPGSTTGETSTQGQNVTGDISATTAMFTPAQNTTAKTPVSSAAPDETSTQEQNTTTESPASTSSAGETSTSDSQPEVSTTPPASDNTTLGSNDTASTIETTSVPGDNATSAPPTTSVVVTTTTSPTTTPRHVYPTRLPNKDGYFVLRLTIGPNANISCNYCNKTYILQQIRNAFMNTPGFYGVRVVDAPKSARRRRRETEPTDFTVEITFHARDLIDMPAENRSAIVQEPLRQLNETGSNLTITESALKIITSDFIAQTRSYCNLENVCQYGYTCIDLGNMGVLCYHLCDADPQWSCGEHGTCEVVVGQNKTAAKTCRCESNYDLRYFGERCEESEIGKEKVAAIVGGVLGAACLVFIIIIVILCWKRKNGSSPSK